MIDDFEDDDDRRERDEAEAKIRLALEGSDTRSVMTTAAGRRFVWRILASSGYRPRHQMGGVYVPGDPVGTGYALGEASVGQRLMGHLTDVDIDLVDLMLKENAR